MCLDLGKSQYEVLYVSGPEQATKIYIRDFKDYILTYFEKYFWQI